jgi:hypothetical protein
LPCKAGNLKELVFTIYIIKVKASGHGFENSTCPSLISVGIIIPDLDIAVIIAIDRGNEIYCSQAGYYLF